MKKIIFYILLIFLAAVALSGCNVQRQYLHVGYFNSSTKTLSDLTVTSCHRVAWFPYTRASGYIPQQNTMFFPVWIIGPEHMPEPYTEGICQVNLTTKKVKQVVWENAKEHREAWAIAADAKWLVWIDGTDTDSGMPCTIKAKNLNSGQVFSLYSCTVENGNIPPQRLHLLGNVVYWSNWSEKTPWSQVVSEIHAYDLTSRRDDIIARYCTNQDASQFNSMDYTGIPTIEGNGIIDSCCVDDGYVYFSLNNGTFGDQNSTGDIYRINIKTGRLEHVLSLYHPAGEITARGDMLVFNDDFQMVQYAPANTLYLYRMREHKMFQIIFGAYFPTISGRFIAWQSDSNSPVLFDVKTCTYYTIPGCTGAEVMGNKVFWYANGEINWADLPH